MWDEPGVGIGLQVGGNEAPKAQVWCENGNLLSPVACRPGGFYALLQLFSCPWGSALFILHKKQKFPGLQELDEWKDFAGLWQKC